MFARLARFADRRAPFVVAGWVILAAVLAVTAPSLQKVGTQDETSFLPGSAPSQKADRLLRRLFPNDPTLDAGILVFARHGQLTAADHAYVGEVTRWISSGEIASDVKTVQSPATSPELATVLRSPDGGAELVVLGFKAPPFTTTTNDAVKRLRKHLDTSAPKGLEHHLTGVAGLAADQAAGLVSSFQRTAIITVLLVLLILVLVYRSAVAPLIPLATIGIAFMVARGVIGLLAAHGFKVASLVETFLVVMIFGAGTDYCLFIVSRYREDLARGEPAPATLRRSMTVVGAIITASAFTVIVGFLSQLTARFGIYRTMGPAVGVAIFVTLVAGLTLTPALLRLAGERAFWPSSLRSTSTEPSQRWQRLAAAVRARPTELLLGGIIVLLLPAAGLGWFHDSFDLVRDLPAAADARGGFDALSRHYPSGTLSPVYLVLDAPGPITDDARLAALDHLTDVLRQNPAIGQVRSLTQPAGFPITSKALNTTGSGADLGGFGLDPNKVDVGPLLTAMSSPGGLRFTGPVLRQYPQLLQGPLGFFTGAGGRSTRLMVALAGNPYDRHALPVIRHLDRDVNAALAGSALSGAHLAVGGPASFFVDMQSIGNSDFRVMSAVLIAGIFVVLALLLRSLVAPFYLLASVILSYAATMGLTALVSIGVFHEAGISFWLPPFLFIILVALGADYNIFIMSRIREEADAGAEVHDAVEKGLVATGHVITSAGFILAGTFAVLVLAPLPMLRQIGFAVTVGVLIDTFIMRSVLVPATTMLLGRWAFWPGVPGETRERVLRPRQVGLATGGVLALAVGLIALVTTAGTAAPITQVSATAPSSATDSAAAGADTTVAPSRVGALSATATTTTRPTVVAGTRTTRGPALTQPPTSSSPTPTHTGPTRVSVPTPGAWRYHLEGTRKVGAAGSNQPFSEDVTTQVSRVGGDDQSPEMRLVTQSSNGSQDDRRGYGPAAVEMLSTQVSSSGISFGGTFQPPQQLIRWPEHVGDAWTSDWTTGSTNGHTTNKVTSARQVTVAGHSYSCWVVQTDTTFSGSAQGQQHQTACWVAELGMSVDDNQQYQGSYNGVSFNVVTHATLLATP